MHDDPPRAGISHHRPGSRACPGYSDFICLDHLAGGVKGWSDRQKHLLLSWPGLASARDHSSQEANICWCRCSWPEKAVSWLPLTSGDMWIRSQCGLSDPQWSHPEARTRQAVVLLGH